MRALQALLPALAIALASACGTEIGDECFTSRDCSPDGDRTCDVSAPGGYCTVVGCNYDSCPSEAICVSFLPVEVEGASCDPEAEDGGAGDCTADETCTLGGYCAPRDAESRFCMRTCDDDGDCREGYECRDREQMAERGGEPVMPDGETLRGDLQGYCAAAPAGP